MTDHSPGALAALWQARRPSGPPVAHTFRSTYADHWVRFHSLPGSKRYPGVRGRVSGREPGREPGFPGGLVSAAPQSTSTPNSRSSSSNPPG